MNKKIIPMKKIKTYEKMIKIKSLIKKHLNAKNNTTENQKLVEQMMIMMKILIIKI